MILPSVQIKIYNLSLLIAGFVFSGGRLAKQMSGVSEARALQAYAESAEIIMLHIGDSSAMVSDAPDGRFLLEVCLAGNP